MRDTPSRLTMHDLVRSGFILAGLLFLAVGIGDVVAGTAKIAQYQDLVRASRGDARPDATALFPTASESEERHAFFVDKLAFYQIVVTAGQLLGAVGFASVLIGLFRLRLRAPRPRPNLPLAN